MSKGNRNRADRNGQGASAGPPADAPQMQPMPVPTQFFTQVITATDGTRWCLMTCLTPVGAQTYWLPQANTAELAKMLGDADAELRKAPIGLIVPDVDVREVIRTMEEEQ
jgi:hypothetical protein